MESELDVLDQLESVSSKKTKENILKAAKSNKKLADLLDATFNFKRRFFIKKFEFKSSTLYSLNDRHFDFLKLLTLLEGQTIRGDKAKESVEEFFTSLSVQQQKWYSRVLKKDLKAGFSISTVNKCGFDIPEFEVMLAKDGKQCKNLNTLVSKGGFLSRKLDGYRCLAVIVDGDVSLYSRNGTLYGNFPSVSEALSNTFPIGKYVFDGEIMSTDFQSMQKTAFSDDKTVGDVKYYIFDSINYDEWMSSNFKETKKERIDNLNILLKNDNSLCDQLQIVDQISVNSLDQIYTYEKQFLSEGFEGAMFLPDISYYLGKKSNRMLKFKTMESMEGWIISLNEGEKGSKFEGTLGSLTIRQENGQLCKCGSGFTDEDRDYMWSTPDKWHNKCIEVKYQELTPDGIMRFPVFSRWRKEKDAL